MSVLRDRWSGDRPVSEVPFVLRRRVHWGDGDAALIAYTGKFLDYALEAADCWWESVLGLNWYRLNRERGLGSPMVAVQMDFHSPLRPGDRVDLTVTVERLGRSSLALRIEGRKADDGGHSFSTVLTGVLIDRDKLKSQPFPEPWRRRIEGYARECALRADGVASRSEILDFWFGPPGSPERGTYRQVWFGKDPAVAPEAFDAACRERFLPTYEAALAGALDHWVESASGSLALCLVLDQFPRNMFRGTPRAFEGDAKAREVARAAIERGHDQGLPLVEGMFLYLPFEHSEEIEDQRRSVALFERFKDDPDPHAAEAIDYAVRHWQVIKRFGRFPHRNAILGRDSTPDELAFLKEPNSSF